MFYCPWNDRYVFFVPSRREIDCHAADCQASVHQYVLHEHHLLKSSETHTVFVLSILDSIRVLIQLPYGGYSGVSQSETIDLTDRDKQIIESLRDWDLWGPLVVCLTLAILLSIKAPVGQASLVFAAVFCAIWFGSAVVTVNAQLLGGTISFFQSVCVLGYCVFPMTLAAGVVDLFKMLPLGAFSTLVELLVLFVAFLWSTRASAVFIGQYIVPSRRILAVFPVLFFYTFLAWMILLF